MNEHSEIIKYFDKLSYKHDIWSVFQDFLFLASASICNSYKHEKWREREDEYLKIIKKYTKEEVDIFPKILGQVYLELHSPKGPTDVLGEVFHLLELQNKWKGQVFTPYSLGTLLAETTFSEESMKEAIKEKGFIYISDPCCGAGCLPICSFEKVKKHYPNNVSEIVCFNCCDIDLRCVYMCYIQLSMLNIPALVYHMDSLKMEKYDVWATPSYVLNGWNKKII